MKGILMDEKFLIKNAFTLAEVLIVVGIIGIIGALTIPTLIAKQQEAVFISQLKKAYSALSQAYKLAEQENGTPDNWGLVKDGTNIGARPVIDMLKPYLNVDKDCADGSQGCFPSGVNYKYLVESLGNFTILDNLGSPKLKLTDGILLMGGVSDQNCADIYGPSLALKNTCGSYYIDINGYKNPNQFGKDVFMFRLTKYGIIPYGTPGAGASTFSSDCENKTTSKGYGCTAWVLYNENMDYLRCDDLAWGGKTKCD